MIGGFELLPFHIILVATLLIYFYGYAERKILIFSLSCISLVAIGIYGVLNGIPYVSGYSQTIADGVTTTIKNISFMRNLAIEISMVILALLGSVGLILQNFDIWKEGD